jgi:hypothetical protein
MILSSLGDIVGLVEILVGLQEDFRSVYGKSPYECPARPPDELDMNLFQGHLGRISDLVDDAKAVVAAYAYLVSWKNPIVTGLSFAAFLHICSRFNPAYFGSMPTFLLIIVMVYLGVRRFLGKQKDRFIRKEADTRRKVRLCGAVLLEC